MKKEIERPPKNRASVILHSTMNGVYCSLLKGFFYNVISKLNIILE